MGGHIVQPLGVVMGSGDDTFIADDDCPHGYFVLVGCGAGLTQRLLHVVFVGIVEEAHGVYTFSVK